MDPNVMQENRFAVFKLNVTVRAHMIKYMTFTPNFSWMLHHHKLERCVFLLSLLCVCGWVCRNCWDCCFQGQGLMEGSKLYWIFMYFICSVPLISWQPNSLCWFNIVNNQTKYNNWAYTDNRTLTYSIIRYTMRGYFAAQGDKPCWSCVQWFYCCFGVRMRPCRFFHR